MNSKREVQKKEFMNSKREVQKIVNSKREVQKKENLWSPKERIHISPKQCKFKKDNVEKSKTMKNLQKENPKEIEFGKAQNNAEKVIKKILTEREFRKIKTIVHFDTNSAPYTGA